MCEHDAGCLVILLEFNLLVLHFCRLPSSLRPSFSSFLTLDLSADFICSCRLWNGINFFFFSHYCNCVVLNDKT